MGLYSSVGYEVGLCSKKYGIILTANADHLVKATCLLHVDGMRTHVNGNDAEHVRFAEAAASPPAEPERKKSHENGGDSGVQLPENGWARSRREKRRMPRSGRAGRLPSTLLAKRRNPAVICDPK